MLVLQSCLIMKSSINKYFNTYINIKFTYLYEENVESIAPFNSI